MEEWKKIEPMVRKLQRTEESEVRCEECGKLIKYYDAHPDIEDRFFCQKCGEDLIEFQNQVEIDRQVDRERENELFKM